MRTEPTFEAWYVLVAFLTVMTGTMIYERSVPNNAVTTFMNNHPIASLLICFAGMTIVVVSTLVEKRH